MFSDEIKVEKVLTQEEFDDLFFFISPEDQKKGKPGFFDGNSDEWIKWLYENNYRLVKLPK